MESDPEVVEAFVRAMHRSLEYATENPEEARQAIAEYTEIPPDVLERVVLPLWQTDLNQDSIEPDRRADGDVTASPRTSRTRRR